MGIAIFPSKWNSTPQGPQQINWNHPLAKYLVAAVLFDNGVGYPRELVRGKYLGLTSGGTMLDGGAANGMVGKRLSASKRAMTALGDSGFPVNSTFDGATVFMRVVHLGNPSGDVQIFGNFYTGSNSNSPYSSGYFDFGTNVVRFISNDNSTFVTVDPGVTPAFNVPITYSGHVSSEGQNFLKNGVHLVDNATSVPLTKTSTETFLGAGDCWQIAQNPNCIIDIGYTFRGPAMKSAGIEELHDNPYALLMPLRRKRYFVPQSIVNTSISPPPGSVTLAGVTPTLSANIVTLPTTGSVAIIGKLATSSVSGFTAVPSGTVTVAGSVPTLLKVSFGEKATISMGSSIGSLWIE